MQNWLSLRILCLVQRPSANGNHFSFTQKWATGMGKDWTCLMAMDITIKRARESEPLRSKTNYANRRQTNGNRLSKHTMFVVFTPCRQSILFFLFEIDYNQMQLGHLSFLFPSLTIVLRSPARAMIDNDRQWWPRYANMPYGGNIHAEWKAGKVWNLWVTLLILHTTFVESKRKFN